MTKIYAILDTETELFVTYNSKCAWSKAGNAKNAFSQHQPYDKDWKRLKFEEQTRYKIVELTEYYWMYKGLQE